MLGAVTGVGLRGTPPSATTYPAGMGEGCLFDTGLSYARGAVADRALRERSCRCAGRRSGHRARLRPVPRRRVRPSGSSVGASQSAWFVNTLIAEGFNVDPAGRLRCVHRCALVPLGRQLARDQPPRRRRRAAVPLRAARGEPLTAAEMLSRPESDPFFVDITSYTEYYRLRGSVFASAPLPARARHYDVPAPHGPGSPSSRRSCSRSRVATAAWRSRSTRSSRARTRVASWSASSPIPTRSRRHSGSSSAPRPSRPSTSTRCRAASSRCRCVDADAQPIGGVRFPDVELPLGRAEPVALPPCGASSIDDGCGNFGGWQPFSAAELAERYGSVDDYVRRYAAILDRFVAEGFVLPRDRDGVIETARASVHPRLTSPRPSAAAAGRSRWCARRTRGSRAGVRPCPARAAAFRSWRRAGPRHQDRRQDGERAEPLLRGDEVEAPPHAASPK